MTKETIRKMYYALCHAHLHTYDKNHVNHTAIDDALDAAREELGIERRALSSSEIESMNDSDPVDRMILFSLRNS